MFILFNNRAINSNLITNISKVTETNRGKETLYCIRVQMLQTQGSFRETYSTEELRDNEFHKLICKLNES